jgi:hypothetical protein
VETTAVHAITGVVRERHAPDFVAVRAATVTVSSGSQVGRTATTDSSGRYVLERMNPERVLLTVVADGFEQATAAATPQHQTPDILLTPQTVTLEWDGRG